MLTKDQVNLKGDHMFTLLMNAQLIPLDLKASHCTISIIRIQVKMH